MSLYMLQKDPDVFGGSAETETSEINPNLSHNKVDDVVERLQRTTIDSDLVSGHIPQSFLDVLTNLS